MILLEGGDTLLTGSHILETEAVIDFGFPLLNLCESVLGRMEVSVTVMQGSYGFCVNWFHYQINDGFIEKKIDNKNKFTYNVKDFERF